VPTHAATSDDLAERLIARARQELSADFSEHLPIQIALATPAIQNEKSQAAVAIQSRADGQIQVFSFNRLDQHVPFTLRISGKDLPALSTDQLRRALGEPGRDWAAPALGCAAYLHRHEVIDLRAQAFSGVTIAILCSAPPAAPPQAPPPTSLNANFPPSPDPAIALACMAALSNIFPSPAPSPESPPAGPSAEWIFTACAKVFFDLGVHAAPADAWRRDFIIRCWRR
jgi:hypothetical protein